jgi:pyruvate dehydrogenase E2 component (dihydrolipoamide acetyltransferase)
MATPILMPRQGQSVESCILVAWRIKTGDAVDAGQIVAEIETDKATFEVESPAAGQVLALFFNEGDDIPVLTTIAAIGDAGENIDALRPGGGSPSDMGTPQTSLPGSAGSSPGASIPPPPPPVPGAAAATAAGVSPRARHAAARHGLDPDTLPGSGPGGRIIERDVNAAAASGAPLSAAAREARAAAGLHAPARGSGPAGRVLSSDLRSGAPATAPAAASDRTDRTLPVAGIRKIIAQRMRESLGSTAQLTMTRRVNASAIQRFRAGVKTHGETFGLPVATVNDLIVFAVSRTLPRHPELNAHFLGDRIVQFAAVNLGIAVDTPRGLMVPVLRNADALPLRDLAAGIRPLAEACQKGNVNPDHLTGGTFTITNLGALGVETFTPVLNAPEVAILGVGGLTLQPVRTTDGIQFVDTLHLSLTIDHQAVDGAPAARFLKDLAESLEHIELLIAAAG